ncbi:MAG: AAA family ATPase [Moraxella sp.]|nr:AAA family ATPase [Moraxella sp.]
MEIIAIANQKGGVGKTTTAVNLSAALALIHKKRVLLIDLDSQGNATTSTGLDKNALQHTMADVFLDSVPLADAIVKAPAGFDVVGANKELAGLDVALSDVEDAPLLLKKSLQEAEFAGKLDYDYVLMDCAPSLNLVTVNAMVATQGVIIPMQCEYYALEGVADLTHTVERLQAINSDLYIRGVVRTMYDNRNMLAQDVSAELAHHFGDLLYKTVIPRNIRLAEAPSFGQSIFGFQNSSKGAQAYQRFSNEVIKQSEQPSLLT